MAEHDTARPVRTRRSCLVVPGASDRMLAKATGLAADQVVMDLEDAVVADEKQAARDRVVAAINDLDWGRRSVGVRINGVTTPWAFRDLVALIEHAGSRLDTVVVPKVESAGDIAFVDRLLTQVELEAGLPKGRIGIEVQLETARGLAAVHEIAAASPRMEVVMFGPGDLAASLRMAPFPIGGFQPDYPGDVFHHVRSTVLVAARAAGLQAIDGPYAQVHDAEGFRELATRGRALGMDGKWVLHPSQVDIANEVFGVDLVSWERAHDVLDAYAHATETGMGAVMFGTEMIDEASRRIAAVTVAQGRAQGDLEFRPTPDEVPFDQRVHWRATNLTSPGA